MFVTYEGDRYDMPKRVSGPYRQHWNSVSFNINPYIFMITHVSGGEFDSEIGNLMVASTELVASSINDREDWDVMQITFLEHNKDRPISWCTHNIIKLDIGKCEDSIDAEDAMFTDIVRMTTDMGDILYIEEDIVTKEPQKAKFLTIFEV